ncbi:MAG: hypothetical protein LBL26_00760 [Peptococcaceae bacterium]|jgi:hypothetical protein|nr:hypothetical protein [Peptococcaceae bacterium]
MKDANVYDVVWPRGKSTITGAKLAKRLDTLEGKVVAELWDWVFKGDVMCEGFEAELGRRYPGIRFISWKEFGEIHGGKEHEVLADLPGKLKSFGVDAVICGVGCCGSCIAAVTRTSILVEKLGIPTVTLCCDGFQTAGGFNAAGEGYPNLPYAVHPGHVNFFTDEEIYKNAAEVMTDQVVKALTVQPADAKPVKEPGMRDIVFSGNLKEVNDFYYMREWSDGLPVIPPVIEEVEKFLRFTARPAGSVVGVLKPDNREATIWNIAVNGVMSGCRPEYMPVLIAIVEGLCDPDFGQEHLGQTPGTETLIIINGKIIKDLEFNYTQGILRPGFQANTSIGRFLRMYIRNVCGFLPHKADKGCFGDNFRIVLAENEDAIAEAGWQPLSADRGFKTGDNVVTLTSVTERTQLIESGMPTAEGTLENIAKRMADNHLFIQFFFRGQKTRPLIILTPLVVKELAKAGYTKEKIKRYLYENAKLKPADMSGKEIARFQKGIEDGSWPEQLGTSADPNRYVQMVSDPDDLQIAVSGDPARDHTLVCAQNGFIGYPVSKKIELPSDWDAMLRGSANN